VTNWAQRSFAAGELAPAIWGRSDLARYAIGLRKLRNFRGLRSGGVETRPGLQYVDETRYPAKKSVVRPFVKNASIGDSYAMEFGDLYLEFIRAGQRVTEAAKNITGLTQANPAVVTIVGHGYAVNDDLLLASINGMVQLNGRRVRVLSTPTADTFTIGYVNGSNVDSTGFTAYSGPSGTASRVYKVTTPYTEAQVDELQYDTLNDVAVIVHRSHEPRKLTRTAHASWALEKIVFNPSTNRPSNIQGSGTAGATTQRYKVTGIAANGVEGLSGFNSTFASISSISKSTSPVVTTAAAHGLSTGDEVLMSVSGMTELNLRQFIIEVTGATTFTLLNVDTTNYGNFSVGDAVPVFTRVPNIVAPSTANPITVTWNAAQGVVKYVIYREVAGSFGFVGYSTSLSFVDTGYTAEGGENPPAYSDRFKDVSGFPGTVSFNQGRLVFGSTDEESVICIASRSNDFYNLTTHDTPVDSDAIEWAIAVKGANQVRYLIPNRRLVALCDSSLVVVEGDRDGILTPFAQNANAYGAEGIAFVRPVVVSGRIVFVQARGSALIDFGYDLQGDYVPLELSNSASHLFDRYAIRDLDAQLAPHPTIWCVRSDGKLVGLTYVRAEEFRCFHWHDTDGSFESVAVVPELAEGVGDDDIDENDAVYFVVKRTVNGATRRYVERLHSRRYTDLRDALFVDSAKSFDGRHTGSTTATLTGGTTWAYTEVLTLTFSVSQSGISVNDVIHLEGADGAKVRFRILGGSGTTYTGRATKTVPVSLRGVATTSWGHAKSVFTGLWHLEAKSVSVLGDGNVFANPNRGTGLTVTNGTITLPNDGDGLPQTAVVVHVGLPYLPDFETLNPETPEGMSMAGKQKIVKGVLLNVFESRGFHVGPKEPPDATPLKNLDEAKLTPATTPDEIPALVTKIHRVPILGEWAEHGST
jgi:hypothetical protein